MWKTIKESFDSPDSYVSLALGLAVVLVVGMIAYNYFKARSQNGAATNPSTEQQTQSPTSITLPTKYTVKDGDTLWSIAEMHYKSGYNWVDIQKANSIVNPDSINAGTVLTIPQAPVIPAPGGDISPAGAQTHVGEKMHTVVSGESLWDISMQAYGTGYKWPDIAKVNNLANPDLIFAGNVLTLP